MRRACVLVLAAVALAAMAVNGAFVTTIDANLKTCAALQTDVKDFFPHKVQFKTNRTKAMFHVEYKATYKIVRAKQIAYYLDNGIVTEQPAYPPFDNATTKEDVYVLYQCGTPKPAINATAFFQVPITKAGYQTLNKYGQDIAPVLLEMLGVLSKSLKLVYPGPKAVENRTAAANLNANDSPFLPCVNSVVFGSGAKDAELETNVNPFALREQRTTGNTTWFSLNTTRRAQQLGSVDVFFSPTQTVFVPANASNNETVVNQTEALLPPFVKNNYLDNVPVAQVESALAMYSAVDKGAIDMSRLELIKFFALFYNLENEANTLFDIAEARYERVKALATSFVANKPVNSTEKRSPRVLELRAKATLNNYADYVPQYADAGMTLVVVNTSASINITGAVDLVEQERLAAEAAANATRAAAAAAANCTNNGTANCTTAAVNNSTAQNVTLMQNVTLTPFVTVFLEHIRQLNLDVLIDSTPWPNGRAPTWQDFLAMHGFDRLTAAQQALLPFLKHRQVYRPDMTRVKWSRAGATVGTFNTVGAAQPDQVLSDLVSIAHPKLLTTHKRVYYRRLSEAAENNGKEMLACGTPTQSDNPFQPISAEQALVEGPWQIGTESFLNYDQASTGVSQRSIAQFGGEHAVATADERFVYQLDARAGVLRVIESTTSSGVRSYELRQEFSAKDVPLTKIGKSPWTGARDLALANTWIYVATNTGLVVLKRDATTGRVSLSRSVLSAGNRYYLATRAGAANSIGTNKSATRYWYDVNTNGVVDGGDVIAGLMRTKTLVNNRPLVNESAQTVAGFTGVSMETTFADVLPKGYKLLVDTTAGILLYDSAQLLNETCVTRVAYSEFDYTSGTAVQNLYSQRALIEFLVADAEANNKVVNATCGSATLEWEEPVYFEVRDTDGKYDQTKSAALDSAFPGTNRTLNATTAYATLKRLQTTIDACTVDCQQDVTVTTTDGVTMVGHFYFKDTYKVAAEKLTTAAVLNSFIDRLLVAYVRELAPQSQDASLQRPWPLNNVTVVPSSNAQTVELYAVGGVVANSKWVHRRGVSVLVHFRHNLTTDKVTIASSWWRSDAQHGDSSDVVVASNGLDAYVASAGFDNQSAVIYHLRRPFFDVNAPFALIGNYSIGFARTASNGNRLLLQLSDGELQKLLFVVSTYAGNLGTGTAQEKIDLGAGRLDHKLYVVDRSSATGALTVSAPLRELTSAPAVDSRVLTLGQLSAATIDTRIVFAFGRSQACNAKTTTVCTQSPYTIEMYSRLPASAVPGAAVDQIATLELGYVAPLDLTGSRDAQVVLVSHTAASSLTVISRRVAVTLQQAHRPPTAISYAAGQTDVIRIDRTKSASVVVPAPTVSGGRASLRFTVQPPLPSGVKLDAATGAISFVAPAPAYAQTVYTITAANGGGSTQRVIQLEVFDPVIDATPRGPVQVRYLDNPAVYTVGSAVSRPNVPTVSNANGALSWSVTPALPVGLTLSPTTGVISGTPKHQSSQTVYTIRAADKNLGGSVSLLLSVHDRAPVKIEYDAALANRVLKHDEAPVVDIPAPTFANKTDNTTFSISPPLPAGLVLDSKTGRISGTASAKFPLTTYVVSASNDGGTASAEVSFGYKLDEVIVPQPVTVQEDADASRAVTMSTISLILMFALSLIFLFLINLYRKQEHKRMEGMIPAKAMNKLTTAISQAELLTSRSMNAVELQQIRVEDRDTPEERQRKRELAEMKAKKRARARKRRKQHKDADQVKGAVSTLRQYIGDDATIAEEDSMMDSEFSESTAQNDLSELGALFVAIGVDLKYEARFVTENIDVEDLEYMTIDEMAQLIDNKKQVKKLFMWVAKGLHEDTKAAQNTSSPSNNNNGTASSRQAEGSPSARRRRGNRSGRSTPASRSSKY
eukprot:TRINITY_DN62953_c0_g1_i1.p1 TRINITY_DN62953_c0_g1~~TRINITY_DN62953_c0_g1_i1.p1  ORF type:complete len:1886 (-),score=1056.32 TRINITY_DN62953_c0_g1_i1:367-6024(-)